MGIFILTYTIGAGRLVWNVAFLNTEDTWRETAHANLERVELGGNRLSGAIPPEPGSRLHRGRQDAVQPAGNHRPRTGRVTRDMERPGTATDNADGRDRMDHNRAASYTWVFPGDALTAAYEAEAIRRLADALGMTIVREYEDEEYGRPQFRRMMDEARSEPGPFGAIIAYDRWRFAAGGSSCSACGTSRQEAPRPGTRRSGDRTDRRPSMKPLSDLLEEHRDQIGRRLHLGNVHWQDLVSKLEIQERHASGPLGDEQIWTFLVGCGYSMAGAEGLAKLTNVLTGMDLPQPDDARIWLEVLPLPPRNGEGNTHVDLAIGSITRRGNSRSGINLGRDPQPWICFCEMKWRSDISCSVTHDPDRNQLARVIENALCFQGEGGYSDEVHVALVTPAVFKGPGGGCRVYQGLFREYESDRARLRQDLDACRLEKMNKPDWKYPRDIAERVDRLELRWPTYEELFAGIPASTISEDLQQFWETYGHIPQ